MNIAEAIAFCGLVIGLIAAGGMWLDAYKHRLSNRVREMELRTRPAPAADESAAELAAIEQRLRVLERIATDRSAALANQIEDLRTGADAR